MIMRWWYRILKNLNYYACTTGLNITTVEYCIVKEDVHITREGGVIAMRNYLAFVSVMESTVTINEHYYICCNKSLSLK